MFEGTYRVAAYWADVPQQTCPSCGETKPATLFPEMTSGARRKRCASCLSAEREARGRKRHSLTGKGRHELLEDFMLQNSK